jgi:hypothetical protein
MTTAIRMAKINLKQSKVPYLIVGILLAIGLFNLLLSELISAGENTSLAVSDYLYSLPLLLSILIPTSHFRKLMHLGGNRIDFFFSSILTYLPVIVVVTLATTVLHYTLYPALRQSGFRFFFAAEVFGFTSRPPVVSFLQLFAFLFLLCCALHTLTLMQSYWYGWATDIVIITIVSVFTPIAPLRKWLVRFFNLIIFGDNFVAQILSCILLGILLFSVSLIPIRTKRI